MHTQMIHSRMGLMHIAVRVVGLAALPLVYLLVIRPWHIRWRTTQEEIYRLLRKLGPAQRV
jgi:hypothetical protein